MAEMRTFVFSVTFIIMFSTLLISLPSDFQGLESDPNELLPVDMNSITSFAEYVKYDKTDFTVGLTTYYDYNLGSWAFEMVYGSGTFGLVRHDLFFGLWLGSITTIQHFNASGYDRGTGITFSELTTDAVSGIAKYSMRFTDDASSAGSIIYYWNSTLYSDPSDAWDNDVLYILHGIGLNETYGIDITRMLIQLLTLQLPDTPLLISLLLATPIWAGVVYLIWYFITKMIPFLGA